VLGLSKEIWPRCAGSAFAQALMAFRSRGEQRLKLAKLAAAQGERDGLFWLGACFRDGEGCEENLIKAKENVLLASELGDVAAMSGLGKSLDQSDLPRWQWWGRAAALGNAWFFLKLFFETS
jgi:TPR repeat protein